MRTNRANEEEGGGRHLDVLDNEIDRVQVFEVCVTLRVLEQINYIEGACGDAPSPPSVRSEGIYVAGP